MYRTVLYCTVLYCAMLYCAALYCTILFIYFILSIIHYDLGAGRSSEVERWLMVQWVTSWGGPIELFLVPASAPRLV